MTPACQHIKSYASKSVEVRCVSCGAHLPIRFDYVIQLDGAETARTHDPSVAIEVATAIRRDAPDTAAVTITIKPLTRDHEQLHQGREFERDVERHTAPLTVLLPRA